MNDRSRRPASLRALLFLYSNANIGGGYIEKNRESFVIRGEAQYRDLQRLGEFDLKTSSWIRTPPAVRALGGALFCDRRYGQVFVYHNGAQSYYAARGFRGWLQV